MIVSKEIMDITDKHSDKRIKVNAINNDGLKVIALKGIGFKAKDFQNGNNPFSFLLGNKTKPEGE